MRFIAACMVIIAHTSTMFGLHLGPTPAYALNTSPSFFFVLSGFLLCYNYEVLPSSSARRTFWRARLARIWPLHVVVCLCALLMMPDGMFTAHTSAALAIVLTLLLLQAWVPISGYAASINPATWTLSVDAFFYAAYPLLVRWLYRRPWVTVAGVASISVAGPLVAQALSEPTVVPLHHVNWFFLDHLTPTSRLLEFVLGMAAARWWVAHGPSRRSVAWRSRRALLVVVLLALSLRWVYRVPFLYPWVGSGVADWLTQIALAPVYVAVIVVLADSTGRLNRVLSHPVATALGEMSFAIYLLHFVTYIAVMRWQARWTLNAPWLGVVYVVVLLGLAWVAWTYVECPIRRWILSPRPVLTQATTS